MAVSCVFCLAGNGGLLAFATEDSTEDVSRAFSNIFSVAEQLLIVALGLVVGLFASSQSPASLLAREDPALNDLPLYSCRLFSALGSSVEEAAHQSQRSSCFLESASTCFGHVHDHRTPLITYQAATALSVFFRFSFDEAVGFWIRFQQKSSCTR